MEFAPSRNLLSEYKSYDELFGPNAVDIEQEEDDLIKSEKMLIIHGWHKIPWKHPLGIFELAFVNQKFRLYKVFLMDFNRWEVEGPEDVIGEGHGVEELEEFLDEIFEKE
jgi:hypothetical protein